MNDKLAKLNLTLSDLENAKELNNPFGGNGAQLLQINGKLYFYSPARNDIAEVNMQ